MGWLRRDRRAAGVPSGFPARLGAAAGELPGVQGRLRDVTSYVVSGEPVRVLTEVATASHQGYMGYQVSHQAQAQLYGDFAENAPDVWVRWGRVLEASKGNNPWTTPLSSAGALPAWLEHLLVSLGDTWVSRTYPRPKTPNPVPIPFAALSAVLDVEGVAVGEFLDAIFTASPDMRYSSYPTRQVVAGMPGFAEAVVAHVDRVSGRVTAGSVEQRILFCSLVSPFPAECLAALAPHLAVAATSTSNRVRDAATPLLLRVAAAAGPALRELAVECKPDARALALELLWEHGTDADRHFARETAAADRTPRIQAMVDQWDTGTGQAVGLPPELEVPAPAPVRWRVEVDRQLRERIEQTAAWHNDHISKLNQWQAQERAAYQARFGRPHPVAEYHRPLEPDLAKRLVAELASDRAPKPRTGDFDVQVGQTATYFAGFPEATPVAVIKVLNRVGALLDRRPQLSGLAVSALESCHSRTGGPDLSTLQQMLDEMGLPGSHLVWRAITSSWEALGRDWPAGDVWPFLARNLKFVIAHAQPAEDDYSTDSSAFYRLIGTLPTIPPVLANHLFTVALGTGKTHRPAAQAALANHPDRSRRVASALTDGRAEVRTVAATWLARIADPEALPALEAAVAKEKQDVAKGAMLDALEALGRPVEDYLDRNRLAADADKTVAKGLPKDLDWLAWDRLPELHWAGSGERVGRPVVQHLVAQAARAKNPEPNAILRKYVGMLVESERRAFAHALLEMWIAHDVRPIDPAEAHRQAHARATQMHSWMQQNPAAFQNDPMLGKSVAELTASYLPSIARTPAGSAASSKGVLAVVAAAGGPEVVPPTERYLKDWYGLRAAQGKALIAMLAWVDHPSATQLLLSIGSRFRTKSFQTEATRQVEALAEREGWTVEELADRTVPTAGFDPTGRLELSYGERTFTARLLPDLTIELRNDAGAVVKSLPTPRQTDDADQAKAAKAAFGAARKELKAVATLQRQRLYEALCTERTWAVEDWQRYLAGHPILRLLAQRLVWLAAPAGGPPMAFRLLDDGTLSDVHDEEVTLPAEGVVRLAHDTNLEPGQVEAWVAHLADYEVQPLFQQLGKGLLELPDELRTRHALEDFKGHTLEAFALRTRALKLGWTRGPAEDGGWFHVYLKRFPTLGLVARLDFTGNSLPEENRTVALLTLCFEREDAREPTRASHPIPLGDVPSVLLSETWHDVRSLASAGGGYDPDWERSTQL